MGRTKPLTVGLILALLLGAGTLGAKTVFQSSSSTTKTGTCSFTIKVGFDQLGVLAQASVLCPPCHSRQQHFIDLSCSFH
jgi:hypothetical protein